MTRAQVVARLKSQFKHLDPVQRGPIAEAIVTAIEQLTAPYREVELIDALMSIRDARRDTADDGSVVFDPDIDWARGVAGMALSGHRARPQASGDALAEAVDKARERLLTFMTAGTMQEGILAMLHNIEAMLWTAVDEYRAAYRQGKEAENAAG